MNNWSQGGPLGTSLYLVKICVKKAIEKRVGDDGGHGQQVADSVDGEHGQLLRFGGRTLPIMVIRHDEDDQEERYLEGMSYIKYQVVNINRSPREEEHQAEEDQH